MNSFESIVLVLFFFVLGVSDAIFVVYLYKILGLYPYLLIYIFLALVGIVVLFLLKNRFKLAKNNIKEIVSSVDNPSIGQIKKLWNSSDMKILVWYSVSVIFLIIPGIITSLFGVIFSIYLFLFYKTSTA